MFCRNCGTELAEGSRFCASCGAQQGTTDAPAPGESEATAPPPVPPQAAPATPPVKRHNWFRRHKITTVLIALIVLLLASSLLTHTTRATLSSRDWQRLDGRHGTSVGRTRSSRGRLGRTSRERARTTARR